MKICSELKLENIQSAFGDLGVTKIFIDGKCLLDDDKVSSREEYFKKYMDIFSLDKIVKDFYVRIVDFHHCEVYIRTI